MSSSWLKRGGEAVTMAAVNRVLVMGAGPAGLTAAHELRRLGIDATVLEASGEVGGISRTAIYKGYRFDIGGHRFFTKVEAVQQLWEELLKEEFLLRPRLSRIYYEGRLFKYPLDAIDVLTGLGPVEALRAGLSYLRAQLARSSRPDRTFEEWVTSRFGRRLFGIFFETYTEKVWGIPCSEIDAEWASQRLRNMDLSVILTSMLFGAGGRSKREVVASLVEQFHYPRFGPGQMWERCAERITHQGARLHFHRRVERILHDGGRILAVVARGADGAEVEHAADGFISSIPVRELVGAFDPALPQEVVAAADQLRYRDFLTVGLIVNRPEVFPDNWIYIHSGAVKVGRIQNFKNWSADMVPDPATTSLGLEYFVQEHDELWETSDDELIALGSRECQALGLIESGEILDGTVIREPRVYPIYDGRHREALATIRAGLDGFSNLELVGRNGLHRYNNQDHSMVTGMLAARNLAGEGYHDVWSVNTDPDYQEVVTSGERSDGDRLVPWRTTGETLEDLIRSGFARYDPFALGGALGILAAVGLFLATVVLLLQTGSPARPMLSLLGNYLLGYEVSWYGAWLALPEAGTLGFCFGWTLARLLNVAIGWEQRRLEDRIERARAPSLIDGTV